jgi:hypothetical protein
MGTIIVDSVPWNSSIHHTADQRDVDRLAYTIVFYSPPLFYYPTLFYISDNKPTMVNYGI